MLFVLCVPPRLGREARPERRWTSQLARSLARLLSPALHALLLSEQEFFLRQTLVVLARLAEFRE
jgi:hypothetical protein